MIVVLTLVPLWIVLWRRLQEGRWTELPEVDRNAAWRPAPASEPPVPQAAGPDRTISPRMRTAWIALGAAGLLLLIAGSVRQSTGGPFGTLPITREQAANLARQAVDRRLGPAAGAEARDWRVMPVADDGDDAAHEFVFETAGAQRWRDLVGVYLPRPRWRVRFAPFEGDVAERAEEWRVLVTSAGDAGSVRHVLPEGRAGASLDGPAARRLALRGCCPAVRPRRRPRANHRKFPPHPRSSRRAPTGRSPSATRRSRRYRVVKHGLK